MRVKLIGIAAVLLCLALAAYSVEAPVNLSGTWTLEKSENSFSPAGGRGGTETGMPGSAQGGGFPGGGYPGGGGGGYPGMGGGGGYPSGGGAGGYPGGGGGSYPGGGRRGGGAGGGYPGGNGSEAGAPPEQANLVLTIEQTADELKITRKWNRDGKPHQVMQTFTLDGKENDNETNAGGGDFRSKTKWHKRDLVTEGTQQISTGNRNFEIHVKEEFSLSKDGQVLTLKTSRITPGGQMQIKQTFSKS